MFVFKQAGVGRNIKDNEVLQGSPAFDTMITVNHTFILRTFQNLLLK
jgi:hypothetical protein